MTPVRVPAGVGLVGSLVAAHFDGDEWVDLAVADGFPTDDVWILIGSGQGLFKPPLVFTVGRTLGLIASDFDRDLRVDLVTNAHHELILKGVSLLLGNGDGTFQPPMGLVPARDPWFSVATDIDGDGAMDLAGSSLSTDVMAVLGRGDGTFRMPVLSTAGTEVGSLAAADFDGDSRVDLVSANSAANDVSVLLGNGAGSFGPPGAPQRFAALGAPNALLAVDLDGNSLGRSRSLQYCSWPRRNTLRDRGWEL